MTILIRYSIKFKHLNIEVLLLNMLQGRVLDEDVVKEVSHGGRKTQRRNQIVLSP